MSLKAMYNEIAHQYEVADSFGSLTKSHAIAFKQIQQLQLAPQKHYKILDLGMGDGCFLQSLQPLFPKTTFTGIDISSVMLKKAKSVLPDLVAVEGSAADISHYVPPHTQAMVIAHFVNAYVPLPHLLEEVKSVMSVSGYFSFITTTYDSFPTAQTALANYIQSHRWIGGVVSRYYEATKKRTTVASSKMALLEVLATHGFAVVAEQRVEIPIHFKSLSELKQFGIEGTWFLNTFNHSWLPRFILEPCVKYLCKKIFTFPYQDQHIIDVVLLKRV